MITKIDNSNTLPPEISVVILCYRAGNFARSYHQNISKILRDNRLDYEIVLVGNFWPKTNDTTPDIVLQIAREKERTIAVIEQKNKKTDQMGWDVKMGLRAATGKTILVMDGDGQIDPNCIPLLYNKLIKEKLDICKAKRISRGDGVYRRLVSSIFNFLMQILFPGIMSKDINGKPKILTRMAYDKLLLASDDWFIDAEIMIQARKFNFKGGEVEIKFDKNVDYNSSVSFKTNFEFLRNIIIWRIKEFW
jgi:glycosyltransferase involved in cell wall biosynthesis